MRAGVHQKISQELSRLPLSYSLTPSGGHLELHPNPGEVIEKTSAAFSQFSMSSQRQDQFYNST